MIGKHPHHEKPAVRQHSGFRKNLCVPMHLEVAQHRRIAPYFIQVFQLKNISLTIIAQVMIIMGRGGYE
jgi:hypothetical protein